MGASPENKTCENDGLFYLKNNFCDLTEEEIIIK